MRLQYIFKYVLIISLLLMTTLFVTADTYYCEKSNFKLMMEHLVAEKKYVPNIYDCNEFSNELARRYTDAGFTARAINVVVDCDSGLFERRNCKKYYGKHAIVRVDRIYVEAVTGVIIDPIDYKNYGIRR